MAGVDLKRNGHGHWQGHPCGGLSAWLKILFGFGLLLGPGVRAAWQVGSNLTLRTTLTVQEVFDDNVYILDTAPAPGLTGPVGLTERQPRFESWITSVTPTVSLQWQPLDLLHTSASYAPEFQWFHNAPSENHVAHRATLTLDGHRNGFEWDWRHQWLGIDGSHLGPVTLRPGDCPCVGGIPLRDRRDAVVYRSQWRATVPVGNGFVRPVAALYVHDFRTDQRPNTDPSRFIYDNYIDRWDAQGGVDLGLPAGNRGHWVVGYRFGHQHQGKLLGRASPYSNDYHRLLLGFEGAPVSWLKLAVLAGPDIRDWDHPPVAFHQSETLNWVDATVTVLPTTRDTVTLRATRYEQPAFTSHSVYEDILYQASWQHRLTDSFSLALSLSLYIGDWQAPVAREDWIWTPGVLVRYKLHDHWEIECSYTHDTAVNQVSTRVATYAEGREYNRNRVGVAVRYSY
jgi:hypothetical protein